MAEQDLCTACLCVGRELFFIGETGLYNVYSQILNEIPIYDMSHVSVRVCWECRALLQHYQTFKQTVKDSYRELLHFVKQNLSSKSSITKQPRLQIRTLSPVNYPEYEEDVKEEETEMADKPVIKVDVEVDYIKTEPESNVISDECDHHSEPETFANELIEINEADKPKKKEKKLKKAKTKKVKAKKKKTKVVESDLDGSSEGLSDLDSLLEYYTSKKETKGEKKTEKKDLKYDESEIKTITLSMEEMVKEREREASADSFLQKEHRCNDCILSFKSEQTLSVHLESKHSESAGPHVCSTCKVRFPEAESLSHHEACHLRRYKCAVCGRREPLLLSMVKHVKNHREYKCDVCGEISGSLFKHQAHMSSKHQEKPQCAECGKMFSSRKTYRYHLNVIHKGQNRFPCPQCGRIYQWKSNLWRHIKNHKARDSGELYCSPCDKKFSSVATYQQHLKISRRHVSENEYSFMCSECGKKFVNKTRLKDHVDWEHLKKINYRCQLCNKPFKSNTSLYVHLQNVHKNKEEKDNLCHVCGKSYQNIAKLKYHIVAMHTGETPYSCGQCPSAFSWYSSLYRHVREVHDKVKLKKSKRSKVASLSGATPLYK